MFFMFFLDDGFILICNCMIYSFIGLLLALMLISIMQLRLGIFNIRFFYTIAGISITLLSIFLLLCRNIELNPGPTKKRSSWFNFSICQWNLNSLTTRSFSVNKFDIISLSESFLDSSILTENNNLKISGYKMVRAHHSCKVKKGGVCMCAYVRKSLPVHI